MEPVHKTDCHFYNAYILNSFYITATDEKAKEFLADHSPAAWVHLNLLGYYQFRNSLDNEVYEKLIDQWLGKCDWRNAIKLSRPPLKTKG